jgi:sec-independent protein translocase protein TatA
MLGFDNPIHLIFVLGLLLLVFGAKRLPEMGRSLGSGMRGFRDALSGVQADTGPVAQPQPVAAGEPLAAPGAAEPVATAAVAHEHERSVA